MVQQYTVGSYCENETHEHEVRNSRMKMNEGEETHEHEVRKTASKFPQT